MGPHAMLDMADGSSCRTRSRGFFYSSAEFLGLAGCSSFVKIAAKVLGRDKARHHEDMPDWHRARNAECRNLLKE
jgi:hypothetical protein